MSRQRKQQQTEEHKQERMYSDRLETFRAVALYGKSAYPDQIDYYDPEEDELI